MMRALGDDTRRAIVEELRDGPLGVQDLADRLPVTRSAVSQHLKVLHDAGLVEAEAQGTRRYYALAPQGFEVLRDYLNVVWAQALEGFAALAEHREQPDHDTEEPS